MPYATKEKQKQYSKQYYHLHKCRCDERDKQYYLTHKEQRRQYNKKYNQTEKGKLKSKKAQLKRLYGLTIEQRKQMYIKQNGCCAICGKPVPYDDIKTDHNHTTNKVRELLCCRCNLFVGIMESDVILLQLVKQYLDKHN